MNTAVFLDRDGVLIEEVNLLTSFQMVRILPGVPEALTRLKRAGFLLVVASNQTVVARGLLDEREVAALHQRIVDQLVKDGAPALDGFFFCPHHPHATLQVYRAACECRKPKSGLLMMASKELKIDLARSFMIGDRITDIIAGARAGCRTVLVETGAHQAPPIETSETIDFAISPDFQCEDLGEAADRILEQT
jgi:D-glycero-D-manno-heptose 1,7-bisphosphate phosphatase